MRGETRRVDLPLNQVSTSKKADSNLLKLVEIREAVADAAETDVVAAVASAGAGAAATAV